MISIFLRILVGLGGLLFLVNGMRWLFQPEGMAKELGMPLLEGVAASTQIGDLGSFFLINGMLMVAGAVFARSTLLYIPAAFLGAAAAYRTLSVLLGYADWALQLIVAEIIMVVVLIVAAKILPND